MLVVFVFLRLEFGLLSKYLMVFYCTLRMPCWTQGISLWCSQSSGLHPGYWGPRSFCSFIFQDYLHYPAALAKARRHFPENFATQLSKLLFPTYSWIVKFFGEEKKSSYVIMHFCPFYNLFIQTSRLLLLFKVNFLEFYSMFRSCQSVKAMVLKIYIYAINFKIAT